MVRRCKRATKGSLESALTPSHTQSCAVPQAITRFRSLRVDNAEVGGTGPLSIRCRDGRIVEIGPALPESADDALLDASGGAVIPSLNDHHIHLFALAAVSRSIRCGPPEVRTKRQLQSALHEAPGDGWIRGVGYHESVAGMLDRRFLDALCGNRPLRIQHRSGRMWFLNTLAERELRISTADGHLFREDTLLRDRLTPDPSLLTAVEETSVQLLGMGVTGLTDTTPTNNTEAQATFDSLAIHQRVNLMGDESLESGSLKIMLDDVELPPFESLAERIRHAHERDRPVAVHCVSRTELVFALTALGEAGPLPGDRIEHAAVTDAATMRLLVESRPYDAPLTVVTQPNFIAERGDQYRADVPAQDHDHLYRCRGFLDAGVPLGGGTDAPFGLPDPWAAMRAAVHRATASGHVVGADERLTPERALALFMTPLDDPGGKPRRIEVGAAADLCVLRRPWASVRETLSKEDVLATVCGELLCTAPDTQTAALSALP